MRHSSVRAWPDAGPKESSASIGAQARRDSQAKSKLHGRPPACEKGMGVRTATALANDRGRPEKVHTGQCKIFSGRLWQAELRVGAEA